MSNEGVPVLSGEEDIYTKVGGSYWGMEKIT